MLKTTKSANFKKEYEVKVNNKTLTIFEYKKVWLAVNHNGDEVMQADKKSSLLKKLEAKQIKLLMALAESKGANITLKVTAR